MKRSDSILVLLLILLVVLFSFAQIDLVKGESTIYIRANGTVEGTNKIQRDGNVYMFTDNIANQSIVVEKDNIVIDGAGYLLQGPGYELFRSGRDYMADGPEKGINLQANGVTVQNLHIENFHMGINHITSSTNATITQNYIVHNGYGIYRPTNDTINSNYIAYNEEGIYGSLEINQNNTIVGNTIANNNHGIYFMTGPKYNFISRNNITENFSGITLILTDNNVILENNITANVPPREGNLTEVLGVGLSLLHSQNNNVIRNKIARNSIGILFGTFSNNNVFYDNLFDNQQQIVGGFQQDVLVESWDNGSRGNFWSDYTGIDANGDGIGDTPYILDENNQDNYPLMAPPAILQEPSVNPHLVASAELAGSYVEIRGTLSRYGTGVSFAPLLISYNVDSSNSWNNLTTVNTDANGDYSALWLPSATGTYQLKVTWEGNASLSKTSTIINLVVATIQDNSLISIASNSTITLFSLNTNTEEISFNVTGPSNTTGYVRLSVYKTLFQNITQTIIYLDGRQLNYTVLSTDNSWNLYFAYSHSTHHVKIYLASAAPEFSDSVVWLVSVIVTVAIVGAGLLIYFMKSKRNKLR